MLEDWFINMASFEVGQMFSDYEELDIQTLQKGEPHC